MIFRKDNKYILIASAVFVAVFLLFFFLFFSVYAAKNKKEIDARREVDYALEPYYGDMFKRGNLVEMESYYRDLKKLKNSKKGSVEELKKKLEIKPTSEFIISKDEKNPGSYYKKILDRKRTELLKESSRRDIEIPESLGFGEEIPPDEDALDLLRFLYIKDQLIRISLESGIEAISSIEHEQKVKTGPERDNMFIDEYPIRMTVQGNLKSIMKVMYRLRSNNRFLILRNLEITSENEENTSQERVLGVGISVAGMTFSEIDEEKFKPRQKPKTNLPKGIPLGF